MEKLERNDSKLNIKIQFKSAAGFGYGDIQWMNTCTY